MISLEQVRQLDIRVKKAVAAVKNLSAENAGLRARISDLESRLEQLDNEASSRAADEQELEVSLQGVLDVLDEVDGETSDIVPEPPAANYEIETVSLDEESGNTGAEGIEMDESRPRETADDQAAVPGDQENLFEELNTAESLPEEEHVDEVSENNPSENTLFGEMPENPAVKPPEEASNTDSPAPRAAEQSPVSTELSKEEIPGVGEVVEFSTPENSAEPGEAVPEENGNSADETSAEDVELRDDEDDLVVEGNEDEFRSEFDIF